MGMAGAQDPIEIYERIVTLTLEFLEKQTHTANASSKGAGPREPTQGSKL